jgi:hypothetical protein
MWPFKKTKSNEIEEEKEKKLEEIRNFRDLHQSFNYRGITMVVKGLWDLTDGNVWYPCIVAEYLDVNKHFKIKKFFYWELDHIKSYN